jgi:hypothetical protein
MKKLVKVGGGDKVQWHWNILAIIIIFVKLFMIHKH